MKEAVILRQLPAVFQQAAPEGVETPLRSLVGVMDRMHHADEQILQDFARYIDAYRAPDRFVTYLSSWVGLGWLFLDAPADNSQLPTDSPYPGGLGALRELTNAAATNAKWCGTAPGLTSMLETATGITGFQVTEVAATPQSGPTFAIEVTVPTRAARYLELARRIVEHEKPAHVTASVNLEQPDEP
jgi:phage tail-like protein